MLCFAAQGFSNCQLMTTICMWSHLAVEGVRVVQGVRVKGFVGPF